jgi:hypothetical protein
MDADIGKRGKMRRMSFPVSQFENQCRGTNKEKSKHCGNRYINKNAGYGMLHRALPAEPVRLAKWLGNKAHADPRQPTYTPLFGLVLLPFAFTASKHTDAQ